MRTALSTLCYIRNNDRYLMLHRIFKKQDVNKDKWIGIGGHLEAGESPEECLTREVKEETGWGLKSWRFHGIVTFVLESENAENTSKGDDLTEYMFLYTSDNVTGMDADHLPECPEGVLEWVPISDVFKLNLWEGDQIFLKLIEENAAVFSLKLIYAPDGRLRDAFLDGKNISH